MKKMNVNQTILEDLYLEQKLSCSKIAELLGGITRQGVWKALKRMGIKTRSKQDAVFYKDGQRCKISQGYFWIYKPWHPRSNGSYVKRAILNLEKKLGRVLEYGEFPHHKDSDRLNDDLENLEVSNRSEHPTIHALLRRNGSRT